MKNKKKSDAKIKRIAPLIKESRTSSLSYYSTLFIKPLKPHTETDLHLYAIIMENKNEIKCKN